MIKKEYQLEIGIQKLVEESRCYDQAIEKFLDMWHANRSPATLANEILDNGRIAYLAQDEI